MESKIIFEDEHLIVYNKHATIMVQPDRSGDADLLGIAEAHCGQKLFVVHRIDRPVSGVVVYAKNRTAAYWLSAQFKERTVDKTYIAAVSLEPEATEGVLVHYLEKMPQKNRSHVHAEHKKGTVRCELGYAKVGATAHYQILRIRLITGKHHQIRAQLAAAGWPIKGDVKYGARRKNDDRSIHLHAWQLGFTHPATEERLLFKADFPEGDALWKAISEMLTEAPA